ncbi:hypothetical protein H0H81_008335 [Sphagnurus paluster]|uniref:Mitochondrial escape protein 2 n=1 Tax=Sphagnurus paluster TaxID=117069 RepID=A0A9P7KIC9_9AGAR|nr:hypothetical protein H0H81_008335 [Sphagnurus paluster]
MDPKVAEKPGCWRPLSKNPGGMKALVIDCQSMRQNAATDAQVIASLATQTGYWPVFTFLNSLNNLIDLVSFGLIGQKAGLSSSLAEQLRQILTVVGTGLKGVGSSHRAAIERQIERIEYEEVHQEAEGRRKEKVRRGIWHDGRLDCVAGNGIICELGIGDEPMLAGDEIALIHDIDDKQSVNQEAKIKKQGAKETETIRALPIVVIRNYAMKIGSGQEELLIVLAQWIANLTENQVAHVIVLSDNKENAKYLAKALQSKPLVSIALTDADSRSSVSFVKQKLRDADALADLTAEQTAYVERLGGRASDLESLIHKVRNGQGVKEAVEDIINRGVTELRKNAFGDDVDYAKNLSWSREQAWTVIKLLSKRGEIPYHDVLIEFPFKGDEAALRGMEHAELISIGTDNGK